MYWSTTITNDRTEERDSQGTGNVNEKERRKEGQKEMAYIALLTFNYPEGSGKKFI